MILLACGDRDWSDEALIEEHIKYFTPVLLVHGAARGADYFAGKVAKKLGIEVKEFPADWKRYGKAAGPKRNQEMLEFLLEHQRLGEWVEALAFHANIGASKGTKDMVRKLTRNNIDFTLVEGR